MAQKTFKRFEGDLNCCRSRLQGRPTAEVRLVVDSELWKYELDLPEAMVVVLAQDLAEGCQIRVNVR